MGVFVSGDIASGCHYWTSDEHLICRDTIIGRMLYMYIISTKKQNFQSIKGTQSMYAIEVKVGIRILMTHFKYPVCKEA